MVAMMAMVNDGNGAKDSQGWWLVGSVGFTRIGLAGLAVWLSGCLVSRGLAWGRSRWLAGCLRAAVVAKGTPMELWSIDSVRFCKMTKDYKGFLRTTKDYLTTPQ